MWISFRILFISSSSFSLLDSTSSFTVIKKDILLVVWPDAWGLMPCAHSRHCLTILWLFLFSSACSLHTVECFSQFLLKHIPLRPLFIVWLPLLHMLPLEPGLRARRHILHCSSLLCRTFSRSSRLKFIQARQSLGHIGRLDMTRCRSLKFMLRHSCGTSLSLMRPQKLHSVTGGPSVSCFPFLSCL